MSIKSSIYFILNQSIHPLVCPFISTTFNIQNIVISRSDSWIINFIIWLAKFKSTNPKGYLSKKNNFESCKYYNVKIKMGKDFHMQMMWMLVLPCLQELEIIIADYCPIYGDPHGKPIFYP